MISRLAAAVLLFAAGITADMASTYVAISSGEFVEGSPIGQALVSRFGLVPGMLLTKAVGMFVIGVPIAVAGATRRLVATAMFGIVGVFSLLAACRNALLVAGLWA
ncbi:hypothetical protein GRS48_08870 [Halorubrum sp. JWXQ-INN 858]|uniref:hypothetical protein n=1 Tax=Halorubrum sp. JWXQ-INN 858 TaxID=2690782 RepID=UPI0013FC1078|nr:hypothetical protein [Halorubrum sp. JWXQ-INN 858]MWV64927.1 hypothetical protein [Halorubrum sp. JWXQ-INN 858]